MISKHINHKICLSNNECILCPGIILSMSMFNFILSLHAGISQGNVVNVQFEFEYCFSFHCFPRLLVAQNILFDSVFFTSMQEAYTSQTFNMLNDKVIVINLNVNKSKCRYLRVHEIRNTCYGMASVVVRCRPPCVTTYRVRK